MSHTALAQIKLSAIQHNLQQVKMLAPDSRIMAVIKADAYGHGLVEVARALSSADGLAVARLEEALALRDAGIEQRLLLLSGYIDESSLSTCAARRVDIVVHTETLVNLLCDSNLPQSVNVWLKHNSGMHRLGLDHEEFRRAYDALAQSPNVDEIILMTHFSGADESDSSNTEQQLKAFTNASADIAAPVSLANSAAIIQHQQIQGEWVRPGIMLYGANPLTGHKETQYPCELRPAMSLKARVVAVRRIGCGEGVGYNNRWRSERDSVIATVSIGYGDGYPRHAKNGTPVIVNGQRASLVGTVSMDLITIDITDCGAVELGDQVELWGEQLAVEEVAEWADTISYELFTSISKRVPRRYIG